MELWGCGGGRGGGAGEPRSGVSAPPERVRGFFGVDAPGATCRIGWIRFSGGAVVEIFHFEPQLPAEAIRWNRVGMTHLCAQRVAEGCQPLRRTDRAEFDLLAHSGGVHCRNSSAELGRLGGGHILGR